jgi:fido (protein-threonine AMPylation protein)
MSEPSSARIQVQTKDGSLGNSSAIGSKAAGCDDSNLTEINHDPQTTSAPGTTPESLARNSPGRSQPASGVSPTGDGLHVELDGAGAGAGGSGASANLAHANVDSTRPLDATRELATAAGSLTYSEVSERLAVNIVLCLDDLLDGNPEDIDITPDWIRALHHRLAGRLFPEWGGRFRTTDVQVGTHLPPSAHDLAVQINNFCLDLAERLRHLTSAEAIADLLAWVDWRFQWIHPFKDFNGRVGRILLVALAYKLGLPPVDPAANEDKSAYFAALRAADSGDLSSLRELWLTRLEA